MVIKSPYHPHAQIVGVSFTLTHMNGEGIGTANTKPAHVLRSASVVEVSDEKITDVSATALYGYL